MWSRSLIVILTVLSLVACRSKKNTVSPSGEKATSTVNVNNIAINNLDFRSFSGRAKTKVEFGNQKQDVTLNIRIDRDKAIWISVTAILGIEAVRILITPDSVKILNKLQGEYIRKPFSYIYRYTNPGITFATLQDMLLGNVSTPLLRTEQLTVASSSDEVQLVGIKDQLNFQYSLNSNKRPKVFRLVPAGSDQSLEAYYGSHVDVNGYNFPQNQSIKLTAADITVNTIMVYNKVEFNEILDLPFVVPATYKVLD